MDNAVAHQLREENRSKSHDAIKNEAKVLIASYVDDNHITTEKDLVECYQAIDNVLKTRFDTAHTYYLARQGFLAFIRSYNKKHDTSLDEPVVPVIAERDNLIISYDWMVNGAQVSLASQQMIEIWQRKRRFSNNDLIESALYCSVMYGGLNDIDALKALYQWLLGERDIYRLQLPGADQSSISNASSEHLALILLSIYDDNYGCSHRKGHILENVSTTSLQRYVEYIPDDMTLCFLYALKDKNLNREGVKSFETIISDICKKLKLQNKDKSKPHLSQLIKYANYHWRQMKGADIDSALSIVRQGKIKTTGLSINELINYNQEAIGSNPPPLTWSELFVASYSGLSKRSAKKSNYPSFSKNLIKKVQDALKGSKASAIMKVELLQQEFAQPNATRLLGWVKSLLSDSNSSRLDTISKYVGCIGCDWLMLTMDETLDEWSDEDFEAVYEEIIQSKIKDGRKFSALQKVSIFNLNNEAIGNINEDAGIIESEVPDSPSVLNELASNIKVSYLDQLKDTQKFTYGRLRAFHDYQIEYYDAPYVYFPWGNKRQVIKASMISPRIYKAMKEYIVNSELDCEQKRLCLVVLNLAYRTGMRIKELIGIKVADVADIYTDEHGQRIEQPQIWLRPNRYRRLKSSSASRLIPVDCLLKQEELEQFIQLYHQQKRLKRRYLFSQGSGDQPLPSVFFSNLMKLIWDRLLGEHDFTFHSFRHIAISQLALVLSRSPLAQVMTDYDKDHSDAIVSAVLANNKEQGIWFGLASLAGHLTPDTTFEHYIHTAHLLAGWQMSQATLVLPITVFEMVTGIGYQMVNRQDSRAYNASIKQVHLDKLRGYLTNKIASKDSLFSYNSTLANTDYEQNTQNDAANTRPSIFIHPKIYDVIALLEELQNINIDKRAERLQEVALRHGIAINEARQIYDKAHQVFTDDRLLLSAPTGHKNQEILVKAIDRMYQMSIEEPNELQDFVKIFAVKQNLNTSSIHFGIKETQIEILQQFVIAGCQLIDASYWQIRAHSEQAVRDIKKELRLDSQIRTGARQNFHGYEVRVVQKKQKRSDKNLAITDDYYASSGVLKYLGYILMILVE